ncbi:hypothetical protein N7G274_006488 [Stereocaulon virgatum]|uniref:Uncharacterized protein n=1 Tax=Stereocaulon virgatum TaxID=373712 RepID=A0ABR4A4T2_9LECA
MPVCTIELLYLSTDIATFLRALRRSSLKPLTVARVVRWIITPSSLSKEPLLSQSPQWDLLLILPGAVTSLPADVHCMIKVAWRIAAGVPSNLVSTFESTNSRLLHPLPNNVPPLTNSLSDPQKSDSTQSLELTDELHNWIQSDESPKGAISMLNLLAFIPGKKEQYLKYGKAFSESVGSRRGGVAKLVGKIVPGTCSDGCDEWDEFALAHYPSLKHFADMIGSQDYQDVNKTWRVPSLKDTCILCTSEMELGMQNARAKL